jgi:hypothetical protein
MRLYRTPDQKRPLKTAFNQPDRLTQKNLEGEIDL